MPHERVALFVIKSNAAKIRGNSASVKRGEQRSVNVCYLAHVFIGFKEIKKNLHLETFLTHFELSIKGFNRFVFGNKMTHPSGPASSLKCR